MSNTFWFLLGGFTALAPASVAVAIIAWRNCGPGLREDADTPMFSPSDLRPRSLKQVRDAAPAATPTGAASNPTRGL